MIIPQSPNNPCQQPHRLSIRFYVSVLLLIVGLAPNWAGAQKYVFPTEPQLRLNPAMHTAIILRVDVDKQERFAVTASNDKSVLVWDVNSGKMLKRLRLPSNKGSVGKAYSVAISPDGEQIAVGGFTSKFNHDHNIYIYQHDTGYIIQKIVHLENVINHLAYSPNGQYLAATLGGANGLRVYSSSDYKEVYADRDYQDRTFGVEWLENSGLVTSSFDGKIRLYDQKKNTWARAKSFNTRKKAFGLAVHPDGEKLAVGFYNDSSLILLELPELKTIPGPVTDIVTNGDIASVSWSYQREWLWAGGKYHENGHNPVFGWQDVKSEPVRFPVALDTVSDIHPLSNSDLLVASVGGLTRISIEGKVRWQHVQPLADFRAQRGGTSIRLSQDGSRVAFGFKLGGKEAAWWDLSQNQLWTDSQKPPSWDHQLRGVIIQSERIEVTNWKNQYDPILNGEKINLKEWETSRSLAIAPDEKGFVLGSNWSLRRFNQEGESIWRKAVPAAWAVAISGDGRWVVAGLGDGTLRWYDYKTGDEQLAFFPHKNRKDWVMWTPEGFFASSSREANRLFGYQLNNGSDTPDFVGAEQLYGSFYRPDLVLAKFEGREEPIREALAEIGDVRQVLADRPPSIAITRKTLEQLQSEPLTTEKTQLTLPITLTDQGGGVGEISIFVNGVRQTAKGGHRERRSGIYHDYEYDVSIPPDAISEVEIKANNEKGQVTSAVFRFQVRSTAKPNRQKPNLVGLAIGIEEYQESSFQLKYAIDDVVALQKTLRKQKNGLYKKVAVETLLDPTFDEIVDAFERTQARVKEDDVFVLYLSGHGVTHKGNYHYLAQDFIWTSVNALQQKTISTQHLNDFLAGIKARKAVVILDTCYSGSYQPDIKPWTALNSRKSGPEDKQAIDDMIQEEKLRRQQAREQETAIERLNELSGRAFFYASTNKDIAMEGYNNHSLYTALLLDGLRGDASQDDNQISLYELGDYLEHHLPKVSEEHFKVRLYPMSHVETNFTFATK